MAIVFGAKTSKYYAYSGIISGKIPTSNYK